ncbi:MAG TPA: nucleotidyltransferase family protein [Chthoniobacterales bacterium]|nr:nucleotidyltransferase family protein [Chthoniobacterales bacterium]
MRNIGAVILAAGGSSRLGQPKQLTMFRGETLIRRAVRAAAKAGCDPIVVVVGKDGDAIRRELSATGAAIVENAEWQRGIGSSIRRGIDEIAAATDAVILLTCDQPLVDAGVIAQLIAEHGETGKPIVASRYSNTLGVPALFERSRFKALLTLPDASGAKQLIEEQPDDVASMPFEEGAFDVDTREDLKRLN